MSLQALMQAYSPKDHKLILASLSRVLFADFTTVPDNVVLLTARGENARTGLWKTIRSGQRIIGRRVASGATS